MLGSGLGFYNPTCSGCRSSASIINTCPEPDTNVLNLHKCPKGVYIYSIIFLPNPKPNMNSSAPLSLSQALTLSLLSPSRTAIGHPLLASLRCPPHGLAQPHGPATSLSLTAVFTQPHGLTASLNHSLIHVFPPGSPFFFLWVHFYLSLLKL